MSDPYTILGVSRGDSPDAIKSAYRKLAMKYHPDKNPGDAEAEEKFKEINAAYDQIKDGKEPEPENPFGGFDYSNDTESYESFFRDMMQQEMYRRSRGAYGGPRHTDDSAFRFSDQKPFDHTRSSSTTDVFIPYETMANGGTMYYNRRLNGLAPFRGPDDIEVHIPARTYPGNTINIPEAYTNVKVYPSFSSTPEHWVFNRPDNRMEGKITVSALDIMRENKIKVDIPDGRQVSFTVPLNKDRTIKSTMVGKHMGILLSSGIRCDVALDISVKFPKIRDKE